jgi:hypothetical protein
LDNQAKRNYARIYLGGDHRRQDWSSLFQAVLGEVFQFGAIVVHWIGGGIQEVEE